MSVPADLVQIQIQADKIFKEEEYCCGHCRRDPHTWGLIISILLWALLICTICFFTTSIGDSGAQDVLMFIFPIFLLVTYIAYLMEAFVDDISIYLWNQKISGKNDILTYIEQLKRTPPVILMGCLCYHYETRTRYVTEMYTEYVNGQSVTRTRTRTETYQEKVISFSHQETFTYREWSDDTGSVSDELIKYNIVKVHLSKTWTTADEQTKAAFDEQYNALKDKYRNRDTYFTSYADVDIDDFTPHVLSVIGQRWSISWGFYAIITILYLSSIIYRYWFDRHSVKTNLQFKKVVKI